MFSYKEGLHPAEFILTTANGDRSFSNGRLTGLAALGPGMVLGMVTTPVVAANSGNTGDASLAAVTVTLGDDYEEGVYSLVCKTEAVDGGVFSVVSPSGQALGDLTVGVGYSGSHINLTIPDGVTDWALGDSIDVTVGNGLYAQHDPGATDGSQVARACLIQETDPSDGDVDVVVLARDAEVKKVRLDWIAGTTEAQKNAAYSALRSQGIVALD
jgi:hypothetical protein